MSRKTQKPIKSGEYTTPTPDGWVGWVEDKGGRWIVFYKADGSARWYGQREESGAVVGNGVDSEGLFLPPPT